MGVTKTTSTLPGGLTPICNDCGIALCWDISEEEYEKKKTYWDEWRCKECYPHYKKSLKDIFKDEEKFKARVKALANPLKDK